MKIVIAGHLDHGKSTLTGRLLLDTRSLARGKMEELKRISKKLGKDAQLAYLADQLKEEREENRTIDTTQIFFKTPKRHYCIIDVPGHVEFIKNMLTGATQADTAILLIDASAGIEEQTRRHAYIVKMLGLPISIAVFNKMDLISYSQERFQKLKLEFSYFLKKLGASIPLLIPVSAREGENITKHSLKMRWHKGPCLIDALDSLKIGTAQIKRPLRFAVQDIYIVDTKTIVAGKVLSGQIANGQNIRLFPSLKQARIEAIKVFGKELKKATAGENIGLILDEPSLAKRGEVICAEGENPRLTDYFKADIFWMSQQSLKINEKLILRCSTQETACSAVKIEKRINSSTFEVVEENASVLKMNESGEVVFRTQKPVIVEQPGYVEDLGRFTLESGNQTRGAGIIT